MVILCGGMGTRFRSVSELIPKGLALINGKPMLEIITDELVKQGYYKIKFCVGHLAGKIIDYYSQKYDASYSFSIESKPLGTGGAILNALDQIETEDFLVLNGDSFLKVNFKELQLFHKQRESNLTIVGSKIEDVTDYGTIVFDEKHTILEFKEKSASGLGYINSGIYLMKKKIFDFSGNKDSFSLEKDFIPSIISNFRSYIFLSNSKVIDIGTFERFQKAQNWIF